MARRLEGISVLIVAESAIVRMWLAQVLRDEAATVHDTASCASDLAKWIGRCPAAAIDLAVIELDARGGAGIEAALALRELRGPDWPWIALAQRDDPVQRAAVRVARAAALLIHLDAPETIATAIADALTFGHETGQRRRELAHARQVFALEDDEVACVEGILDERTNLVIARHLGCNVGHSRTMTSLQEKLGVATRGGVAARIAAHSERRADGAAAIRPIDRSGSNDRSIDRMPSIE